MEFFAAWSLPQSWIKPPFLQDTACGALSAERRAQHILGVGRSWGGWDDGVSQTTHTLLGGKRRALIPTSTADPLRSLECHDV